MLRGGGGVPKKDYPRKHDVIFRYGSNKRKFNVERKAYGPHAESGRRATDLGGTRSVEYNPEGTPINDWWVDVKPVINWNKERLGYPTQKPLKLLDRIVKASSDEGDCVLDPFCGCGTTVHAANDLGRNWIGIDISKFSVGLIKNRILHHFEELDVDDIQVIGSVSTLQDALDLAKNDKFEFEKWVCGEIGAGGMYHAPGERGADGGVDGVIPFYHSETMLKKSEPTYAIVQVKGGSVSVNDVKALSTTVRQRDGKCGVFVCFDKYMKTVNNQREKKMIKDAVTDFPFIQGLSVEQLINGKRPNLPCFQRAA